MITNLEKELATIGIATDPTLDEKGWSAINAISGIAGHLQFHTLIDTAITQPSKQISLITGWNVVVYTGTEQRAGVALTSLWNYLISAYYLSAGVWVSIGANTLLEPGMLVIVSVNQDCVLQGDWAANYTEADLPVTIPCGHAVLAIVLSYNDDSYAGHIFLTEVEFLNPDNVAVGLAKTRSVISPGEYAMAWTDIGTLVTLDKPGSWVVHAVLSG